MGSKEVIEGSRGTQSFGGLDFQSETNPHYIGHEHENVHLQLVKVQNSFFWPAVDFPLIGNLKALIVAIRQCLTSQAT